MLVVVGGGGDRDPHKRPVMGAIAARGADVAVLTNDNPRSEDPLAILAAMRAGRRPGAGRDTSRSSPTGGPRSRRRSAAARPGDVVVVAGKGHEQGQEVAGVVHPFDDRAVLRGALGLVRR